MRHLNKSISDFSWEWWKQWQWLVAWISSNYVLQVVTTPSVTEGVIATWSNQMKFRLSGWLLREGWHVDSEADDDAMEMTGIMIIWKSISALKQKLI